MSSGFAVRFSERDLELFSKASGDNNPLHLSAAYASRTAYGQRVVFGALGCLASLGSIAAGKPGERRRIQRLTADFLRPIFLDVDYRAEATTTDSGLSVRLFDGSTPVVTTSVQFAELQEADDALTVPAIFPRTEAQALQWEQLRVSSTGSGVYNPDATALMDLCTRWNLSVSSSMLSAVLWSSYFVGMEQPGRSALFFRAAFDFSGGRTSAGPLRYETRVVNLNQSLAQIRTAFELLIDEQVLASGQLTAFVRPELRGLTPLRESAVSPESLAGKTALVLGASRGFGAEVAVAMAAAGAKVFGLSRSEAEWLPDLPAKTRDRLHLRQGDAGKLEDLARLSAEIEEAHGGLDFLICSAFPAIPSLRLEGNAAARIQNYIQAATALVLHPLCIFLSMLEQSRGCTALISSVAVEKPVRDWPHYVAAKSAAEQLCQVAVFQYPATCAIILRPERLLTEMTNTPMGRRGALPPIELARQLVGHLKTPPRPGTCSVIHVQPVISDLEAGSLQAGIDAELSAPASSAPEFLEVPS